MEMAAQSLSTWFYLGVVATLVGLFLIYKGRGNFKSKLLENGYFILILGLVGIISQWTDFATVLFIFVVVSGSLILVNKLGLIRGIIVEKQDNLSGQTQEQPPHYIYYAKEFFPIVLVVWLLRAFLFEAYEIPSSSMRPDLIVGDFILVNKFTYGIRNPFTNNIMIPVSTIKRGDVVVFKDQTVKNRDLIKRVIGLGGDKIEYYNKRLTINGIALKYEDAGTYDYTDYFSQVGDVDFHTQKYIEDLLGVKHEVITWDQVPPIITKHVRAFPKRNNCTYDVNNDGFTCVVPQGEYFMMGDNRDNSEDGRYWGFVPEQSILGKAMYVWLNFHEFKRIGTKISP